MLLQLMVYRQFLRRKTSGNTPINIPVRQNKQPLAWSLTPRNRDMLSLCSNEVQLLQAVI